MLGWINYIFCFGCCFFVVIVETLVSKPVTLPRTSINANITTKMEELADVRRVMLEFVAFLKQEDSKRDLLVPVHRDMSGISADKKDFTLHKSDVVSTEAGSFMLGLFNDGPLLTPRMTNLENTKSKRKGYVSGRLSLGTYTGWLVTIEEYDMFEEYTRGAARYGLDLPNLGMHIRKNWNQKWSKHFFLKVWVMLGDPLCPRCQINTTGKIVGALPNVEFLYNNKYIPSCLKVLDDERLQLSTDFVHIVPSKNATLRAGEELFLFYDQLLAPNAYEASVTELESDTKPHESDQDIRSRSEEKLLRNVFNTEDRIVYYQGRTLAQQNLDQELLLLESLFGDRLYSNVGFKRLCDQYRKGSKRFEVSVLGKIKQGKESFL